MQPLMLSAAHSQSAVQPCASQATAQYRPLTRNQSVRVCFCCKEVRCLRPPIPTYFRRRKLRQLAGTRHRTSCASVQVERPGTPVDRRGFEWATNVSRHGNVYFAVDETSQACLASMGDSSAEPTVALFFASSSYSVEFDRIIPVLRSKVPSLQHIIGCTVSFHNACMAFVFYYCTYMLFLWTHEAILQPCSDHAHVELLCQHAPPEIQRSHAA